MKNNRQKIIIDIINNNNIETQNDLLCALKNNGIESTQATLSRDIKELKLVKEIGPNNKSRYVKSNEIDIQNATLKLNNILRESVISIESVDNLVVIKTLPGLASAACSAIDNLKINGILGTIAGDDTAFIAMKSHEFTESFKEQVNSIIL